MRILSSILTALLSPPSPHVLVQSPLAQELSVSPLTQGVSTWLTEASSPSLADIQLLQEAFATFYSPNKDLDKSEKLLTDAIGRWQDQADDERAGLFRVRGDCFTQRADASRAVADYSEAIKLLEGNKEADPTELPISLLGRARALKSLKKGADAAADYERAIQLSSRDSDDTASSAAEKLQDGILRNPYAAWEWGSALRLMGDWKRAALVHLETADAFESIGDKARSVIAQLDSGIDLAAAGEIEKAKIVLENVIPKTKGVEGRDVALLQRVIAKEGEGRMALAATLWNAGEKAQAESYRGEACLRLDQLQVDAVARMKAGEAMSRPAGLSFGIDDDISVLDMSCTRFRNKEFLSNQLGWPESLQDKVMNLETLK